MLSSPLLPALWLPRAAQRLLRHPLDMGLLGIRVQKHTPSGVCVLFTLSLCFALARSVCLSIGHARHSLSFSSQAID